ncbi:MAG: hypothetical protein D8M59_09150 [Planctomycetes bacterium]|nr:hypothetical protein [Planctomycetota bacterium]NOG54228.1 hypothetical protein [Planctomycetota bacterium]
MATRWYIGEIADAVYKEFARRSEMYEQEQSVRGLDSLDELAHHVIIQAGLRQGGFGVYPEERYPKDAGRRKRSEGDRCDVVLTADSGQLADPGAADTLFAELDAVPPDEAFWLEVKTVRQFTAEGPNPAYSAELSTRLRSDVAKLVRDRAIRHAGLLVMMYVSDQMVASHDLQVWERSCSERGLPIGVPSLRWVSIGDRIGHLWVGIAVYPVIRTAVVE